MIFEWDERKRQTNLRRHGLDFNDVEFVFENETSALVDDRFDYGETRWVSFGMLNDLVVAVVYTQSDETMRVISFRRATKNEEKEYYKSIRD
jgi:uncharacterized DUF497 family protein